MRNAWRHVRTPLTLLILIVGLVFAAQWGWRNVMAPLPEPATPDCIPQAASTLESSQVSVRVYNGSSKRGLARHVANLLGDRGFNVIEVGNVEQQVTQTIVVGGNEHNPEVKLTAQNLAKSATRGDGRNDGTVDVLVGSEYHGIVPNAPKSINVPGDQVCLPQETEPPAETG
ncbi:LytR C-terminal domain-containing protein [Enemella sp. A6]|uniref:LytR C-terminal domain-containing protein n=1 Tax=Enemella sp. A6 TaxID=3440152 RepID=UPI003EBEAEDB